MSTREQELERALREAGRYIRATLPDWMKAEDFPPIVHDIYTALALPADPPATGICPTCKRGPGYVLGAIDESKVLRDYELPSVESNSIVSPADRPATDAKLYHCTYCDGDHNETACPNRCNSADTAQPRPTGYINLSTDGARSVTTNMAKYPGPYAAQPQGDVETAKWADLLLFSQERMIEEIVAAEARGFMRGQKEERDWQAALTPYKAPPDAPKETK
jgi:hypothetical protein